MEPFKCPRCGAEFSKFLGLDFHRMTTRGDRCEQLAPGVVEHSCCREPGCMLGENHDGPHQSLEDVLAAVRPS